MMLVNCMHASLQYSDPAYHKQHDVNTIFARARKREVAWITGTEAGMGGGPLAQMVVDAGKEFGFRVWMPSLHKVNTGTWVAVNRDFMVPKTFQRTFIPVVPTSAEVYEERHMDPTGRPRWGRRGLSTVSFLNPELGTFNVAAGHYIVRKADMEDLNREIAAAAAKWGRSVAKGKALAFYAGDQNLEDSKVDTFFDGPFTSAWDELEKYANTGHGNIDVIASYDRDKRVKADYIRAVRDARLPLFTDHFLVEAGFEIGRIRL